MQIKRIVGGFSLSLVMHVSHKEMAMSIPWYLRDEVLHDEWCEQEMHRRWWHGFWWGILIGIAFMTFAFTIDVFLKG